MENNEFTKYKDYCKNNGYKPSHGKVLSKYINDLENADIKECDCCGEVTANEYMYQAQYDYDKEVCEQCKKDGN